VQAGNQHGEGDVNTTHPPSQQRLQALEDLIDQEQLENLGYPTQKDRFEKYVATQQSEVSQSRRCLRESPDSAIRICQ
jgi:hypothetical protein